MLVVICYRSFRRQTEVAMCYHSHKIVQLGLAALQ